MWRNNIVPLGSYLSALKPHAGFVVDRDIVVCLVGPPIDAATAVKSLFRASRADVFQNGFITHQQLACPVAANQTEHSMVDRIPFAGPSREMRYDHNQVEFVCEVLKCHFPFPLAVVVRATTVGLDQQPPCRGIAAATNCQPPARMAATANLGVSCEVPTTT